MNQSSETRSSSPDATQLPPRIRWRRAFRALGRVLRDPEQTDQVLVFSTYANAGTLPRRIQRFLDEPGGQRLYRERRTIDSQSIDLEALGKLPEGTLGRAYADFLRSRGLSPDVFEGTPDEVSDPAMAYVIQRMRQTHDLWHVVTGYDTDPASEVALQAFTFGQLGAPSSGILAVLGTVRGMSMKPDLARDIVRALRLGRRTKKLAIFPWEDYWSTPLVDVRRMLGLPVDPHDARRLAAEVRAVIDAMATETGPAAATEPTAAEPATEPTAAEPAEPEPAASRTSKRLIEIARASGVSRARRHRRMLRRAWRAARREQRHAA